MCKIYFTFWVGLKLFVNTTKYGSAYIQLLFSKIFQYCFLWDNVQKYGTSLQNTADNIIWRMRLACCITIATDTHSPYTMIIAVVYVRIPHRNIRPTLSFWLKIREILSYTIRPTIHVVTLTFRFSQRFNNIPFLLLYESTLMGNGLQIFREKVGVSFLKRSKCPSQCFPSKI